MAVGKTKKTHFRALPHHLLLFRADFRSTNTSMIGLNASGHLAFDGDELREKLITEANNEISKYSSSMASIKILSIEIISPGPPYCVLQYQGRRIHFGPVQKEIVHF